LTMDTQFQSEIKQKAGQGIFVLILRYGLNFFFNFAGSVFLIRKLGAAAWGQYAFSFFILTSFIFITYGLWGYIIQKPETPEKELGTCFTIQQLLGLGWGLVVLFWVSPWAMSHFGGFDVGMMIIGAVIGGYFYSWRNIISAWQERKMDYVGVGASEVIDALVFNLTAVILAWRGNGVLGIALGNALRGMTSAAYLHYRSGMKMEFGFNWEAFKGIFRFGFPYVIYSSLSWLPTQVLPLLVGFFLGPAALGYVNLAYRTMEYPRVVVALVARVSMSYYSRLAGDMEIYKKEMLRGLEILFILIAFGISCLSSLSLFWVPWVYGKEWRLSAIIMMIISVPYIINGCMTFLSIALSARGRVTRVATVQLIYNIAFWAGALVLIPRFKDLGLPLSEWVALPFGLSLLYFVMKDSGRFPVLGYAFRLLQFAAGIASIGLFFAYGHQLLGLLTFTVLFVIFFLTRKHFLLMGIKYASQLSDLFK